MGIVHDAIVKLRGARIHRLSSSGFSYDLELDMKGTDGDHMALGFH